MHYFSREAHGAGLKAEGDLIQLGKSEGEFKECRGHPNLLLGCERVRRNADFGAKTRVKR
jgi:hypothetical protein